MSDKSVCKECKNRGWIIYTDEQGYSFAKPCKCEKGLEEVLSKGGVPRKYLNCDFSNFVADKNKSPYVYNAKLILQRFVKDFLEKGKRYGILIKGTIGCGKTHLAAAVLRELAKKGFTNFYFVDFKELLDDIKETFSSSSSFSEADVLYPVLNSNLLVIDDLGSERNTEWTEDVFARILNYRYNRDLPLIITTNYFDKVRKGVPTEETLGERIGTRMRSRLYEMCEEVEIIGTDFRKYKNKIIKEIL